MKKYLICTILSWGLSAYSQVGLVKVQSSYLDLASQDKSLTFTGRGFIVDYPVYSELTKKTANLKVVLTAAHLVFGGIAEERLDNYKIYDSMTDQEFYGLGMISDVIHDGAAIVLCTREALDFFSQDLLEKGTDLKNLGTVHGQPLLEGGACTSKGLGKISETPKAFAYYKGAPVIVRARPDQWIVEDKSIKGQIVVPPTSKIKYLFSDSYAIPLKAQENVEGVSGDLLLEKLKPLTWSYTLLSDIPNEYQIPLRLEKGYSGSPVLSLDKDSQDVIVRGIYKASTETTNTDSYGQFGWVLPAEINSGLIEVFLNRYTLNLHRWHTVPQGYLFLENGHLLRSIRTTQSVIVEDGSLEDTSSQVAEAETWVRSDTGETLWVRSDTGENRPVSPRKSRQLISHYHDGGSELLAAIQIGSDEDLVILPPVINSLIFVTENSCQSCVNSKQFKPELLNYVDMNETGALKSLVWKTVSFGLKAQQVERLYQNSNEDSQQKTIAVRYSLENEKLKIKLSLGQDEIEFFILENNSLSYQKTDDSWTESSFASVLETKTIKKGTPVLIETAGLIYYNSELPNPNSFRFKVAKKQTELFEFKD